MATSWKGKVRVMAVWLEASCSAAARGGRACWQRDARGPHASAPPKLRVARAGPVGARDADAVTITEWITHVWRRRPEARVRADTTSRNRRAGERPRSPDPSGRTSRMLRHRRNASLSSSLVPEVEAAFRAAPCSTANPRRRCRLPSLKYTPASVDRMRVASPRPLEPRPWEIGVVLATNDPATRRRRSELERPKTSQSRPVARLERTRLAAARRRVDAQVAA
jgi:hypothetical protein